MHIFLDYWWCFLIFAVIVSAAIVGLCIGHKKSLVNPKIEEQQKMEENEQKPQKSEENKQK